MRQVHVDMHYECKTHLIPKMQYENQNVDYLINDLDIDYTLKC